MSFRVVLGAGIDNGEPASPVATDWQCFISKPAKEAVFQTWVERDTLFIRSLSTIVDC